MRNRKCNKWSPAIAFVVLSVSWVTIAAAQGRGGPPPDGDGEDRHSAANFIERLDKDSDGKVSESEFDGPDEHFVQADKNKDGYISEDEAPTGPPPGRQGGGRGGRR